MTLKAHRHGYVAAMAIANETVRVANGVIRTGKPYDPTSAALANR